jgi:hypothetical protein
MAWAQRIRSHRRVVPPAGLGMALGSLAAVLTGAPAWAGSATAESIWDRAHALEQARQQVPQGAVVTRERCQEIEVGLDNIRYRCTVEWRQPSEAGPDPANPAPPGG